MKSTYKLMVRKRVEAALSLRLRSASPAVAVSDNDPTDLDPSLVDMAVDEITDRHHKVRTK